MTATSSIPAVIDALLTGLRARPALQEPGRLVTDGFPTKGLTGTHLITIGGQAEPTADGEQSPAAHGTTSRNEEYRLRVYCSSVAAVQKDARDQAFDLMAEVEQLLDEDCTLGGAINRNARMAGAIELQQTSDDPDSMPDGKRWAQVSFDVRITNRLS